MRCTALTVLFFAFIALFSTMAYAAPVAPQGVIVKRQTCSMSECRGATSTPAAASSSDDRITLISSVITQLLALMGTSNNAPSNDVSTPTVVTASSSSAAPASDPTGCNILQFSPGRSQFPWIAPTVPLRVHLTAVNSHGSGCRWGSLFKFPATLECLFSYTTSPTFYIICSQKNMFSIFSVLVTSLRPRKGKASVPIASREDLACTSMSFFGPPRGRAGSNRLARLNRLCANATGHTSQQPEASSIPSVYQGRSPTSRSSNPLTDSTRRPPPVHLSRIECHHSAIRPAVEPLSHGSVEQVTVNPKPYFVPSTASASEILANVAIQDLLAQDAESYDLPCQLEPTNIPTVTSVSDSWDSFKFDFVNPFARDDYSDSDWEAGGGEEETTDYTLQSPSKSIESPNQFRGLNTAPLPSLVHINREIQLISSSVVEVTLRNAHPDSLSREDHGDGEEAIIIPVTPFPHPHLLSPIIEEDEDDGSYSPQMDSEDEDETSDTETIRPSTSTLARPRLSVDTRIDWGVW
ncbi:hypothetical protein F5888DRAFT_1631087 [Russula emetica]|nr:hypothetical protein F5888DRAFT_1631087 [Russula emetica]